MRQKKTPKPRQKTKEERSPGWTEEKTPATRGKHRIHGEKKTEIAVERQKKLKENKRPNRVGCSHREGRQHVTRAREQKKNQLCSPNKETHISLKQKKKQDNGWEVWSTMTTRHRPGPTRKPGRI